jgi:uncharacterized phage-associated protein
MFREVLNSKIGNLVAFLATEISPLSLTKLLKLLYIIDEKSIRRTGIPITWLEYKAWGEGPVAKDIYDEIKYDVKKSFSNKEINLSNFITVTREINNNRNQEEVYITPIAYSLSEFSRYEKELIRSVISEFGKLPASRLIAILHENNSLWSKTVETNDLTKDFASFGKKSDVTIHFGELIKHDELLQLAAQSAYESLSFNQKLC